MSTQCHITLVVFAVVSAACTGHLRRSDPLGDGSADAGQVNPDTGPAEPTDADVPPPTGAPPGTQVDFFTYASQHERVRTRWGDVLTDIVQHLPTTYGDTYADPDFVTYGHETTHGIHAHLRNNFDATGRATNAFYVLEGRAVFVVEPAIRKSEVAFFVPESLRGPRYELYVVGAGEREDSPLYIWDEWVAYTNGGAVGVDRVHAGLWTEGWRDAVAGPLELTVYAIAVAMAVEELDPVYFREYRQFREFLAFHARRAMDIYREGAAMETFAAEEQETYLRALWESEDAEAMRAFVTRHFGSAWSREVLAIQ